MGQLPEGSVFLVETVEDVETLTVPDPTRLAHCSQTTLSVDDTSAVVDALKKKFPAIVGPNREDICYATTNRQLAVKEIAPQSDVVLVIGSPNSSNSNRLVEVAKVYGCANAHLVQDESTIPWSAIDNCKTLGLTAGASAPDILIENVISALKEKYDIILEEIVLAKENVVFNIPRILREAEDNINKEKAS
jgi:4-hydroxy-3-methylbut-2-enyl diphosphate reductase